jgi:hypothetical protein
MKDIFYVSFLAQIKIACIVRKQFKFVEEKVEPKNLEGYSEILWRKGFCSKTS